MSLTPEDSVDVAAAVLISLHPRFADAMDNGEKTVELRRRFPVVPAGTPILIYATLPRGELYGWARVIQVHSQPISELWEAFSSRVAVTKEEFDQYFFGCERGFAVELSSFEKLANPLQLARLRASIPGFHPPQSFRYLRNREPAKGSRAIGGEWLVELFMAECLRFA